MKRLILICFIFLSVNVFAQDWALFPANQKSYYTKSTIPENIEIALADSSIISGETEKILFSKGGLQDIGECLDVVMNEIDLEYYFCNSEEMTSNIFPFIDSLLIRNDSVFFYSDSINYALFFLYNSFVGDKWNILGDAYPDIYIECVGIEQEEFFGITDSVKTFEFYKEAGTTILDAYQIKLSKHYGLIQFIDFNYYAAGYDGITTPEIYQLAGLETADEELYGFYLPDYTEYFPYYAGDALYWMKETISYDPINSFSYIEYAKKLIKERHDYADSIVFLYDYILKDISGDLHYYLNQKEVCTKEDYNNLVQSAQYWIAFSNIENIMYDAGDFGSSIWCTNEIGISEDSAISREFWFNSYILYEDCFTEMLADAGYSFEMNTISGINKYYYGVWYISEISTLVGYTIGGEVFGDTTVLSVPEFSGQFLNLNIYPNPASYQIHLNLPSNKNYNYKIYNFNSLLISAGVLESTEIQIADLQQGIYFLELQNENEILRGKFVKM